MPLETVRNRSLADDVFTQLIREILRGHYAPGMALPAERTMTEIFSVNRHVVREALKRLQQIGLVAISQGGGTKVLDYRRSGGIDLLPMLGEHAGDNEEGLLLWRSILEMRAAIAIDMARLCALRASPEVRQDVVAISQELQAAQGSRELYELEVRFWYRVVDGSQNMAYQLALNAVLRNTAIDPQLIYKFAAWEARAAEYRVPLATAIANADPDAAEQEARSTMRAALAAFYERTHEVKRWPPPRKED